MAAPSYAGATSGGTDTGGAWGSVSGSGSAFFNAFADGDVVIVHLLQDGTTSGAVTGSTFKDALGNSVVASLDGTADVLDYIGEFAGGGCMQHLWIGRKTADTAGVGVNCTDGANSTSEDIYVRTYSFSNVSTGTTLASVIEQNGTTTPSTASGTSGTIADAGVTTTGPDRLALNFVGGNDDNALDAFSGMSGGTWAEAVAEYAESSGTDGVIGLQIATMASAGTIDGGTDEWADATDGWGVVGFALIGTTSAAAYGPPFSQNIPVRMRL